MEPMLHIRQKQRLQTRKRHPKFVVWLPSISWSFCHSRMLQEGFHTLDEPTGFAKQGRHVYKLRYYLFNHTLKSWLLLRGLFVPIQCCTLGQNLGRMIFKERAYHYCRMMPYAIHRNQIDTHSLQNKEIKNLRSCLHVRYQIGWQIYQLRKLPTALR